MEVVMWVVGMWFYCFGAVATGKWAYNRVTDDAQLFAVIFGALFWFVWVPVAVPAIWFVATFLPKK